MLYNILDIINSIPDPLPNSNKPEGGATFSLRYFAELENDTAPNFEKKEREKSPYGQVEFGYCRPFPDPDQLIAYCIQRYAGNIEDSAKLTVSFGKSTDESQNDPSILKLEATYDRDNAYPEDGNYAHRFIENSDGTKQEISIAYATFVDLEDQISESHPEKVTTLRAIAEYADALDLKSRPFPKGMKPPFVTDIFRGAFLAHYRHPELSNGVDQTNVSAGINECYEIFEGLMDSDWTPEQPINVNEHPRFQELINLNETVKNHDREILKRYRPEVVELANGVHVGFLDLRDAETILPMGGYAQGYNYQDPVSKLHASVAIMAFSERDASGEETDVTKLQIAVNTGNPIVASLGIDLNRFKDEWNNREAQEGIGVQALEPGVNWVDGHTHPSNPEIMTLISSPTETGAGIDPLEIQNMMEAYFSVDRLTEAEMTSVATMLGYEHASVQIIPGQYPNTNLRERAIITSKRYRGQETPAWYTPVDEDLIVIRESDLQVTREKREKPTKKDGGKSIVVLAKPPIESVFILSNDEKSTQSHQRFERCMIQSPRAALAELAKGYVDINTYASDPTRLLDWFEGLAQNPRAIEQIYDPRNNILTPPNESLQSWATSQDTEKLKRSQAITKYSSEHGSVPFAIDTQLQRLLYEHGATGEDPQFTERYLSVLETILVSEKYQESHGGEFYDHLPYDVLHIALNIERAQQSLQSPERLLERSEAQFHANAIDRAQKLLQAHATPQMREQLHTYIEQRTHPSDSIRERALELLDANETHAISQPLEVTETLNNRKNLEVLAILVGRQIDRQGQPLTINIERDLGNIDTYVFSPEGELAQGDFMSGALQIVEQIDAVVERIVRRMGENEKGEVRIVVGGPLELYAIAAQRAHELQQMHPTIDVRLYKWMRNGYEPALNYNDVLRAQATKR